MEIRENMSFWLRLLMGFTKTSSKPEMSGEEFARSINLINATQFVIPCLRTKKKSEKVSEKISEETPVIQNTVNAEEIAPVTEEKPLKRLFPWLF